MSVLPREEKLPINTRLDLKENWLPYRENRDRDLSEVMGTSWTFDVDPNSLYPYCSEYSQNNLGYEINNYCKGAVERLNDWKNNRGAEAIEDINTLCYAHKITIGYNPEAESRLLQAGCEFIDGKLRILFSADCFGNNAWSALEDENLVKGLNLAPLPDGWGVPFAVRANIRRDFDRNVDWISGQVAETMRFPNLKFKADFEGAYKKLEAEAQRPGNSLDTTWQYDLGESVYRLLNGVNMQLDFRGYGSDSLLREAFKEHVHTGAIMFRIVDDLVGNGDTTCECEIEDGVLFLQCTPDTFHRMDVVAAVVKLADIL